VSEILHLPNGDIHKIAAPIPILKKRSKAKPWVFLVIMGSVMSFGIWAGRTVKFNPQPVLTATDAPTGYHNATAEEIRLWAEQQKAKDVAAKEEERKDLEERENIWVNRPRLSPPFDPPPSVIKIGPYLYTLHYTSAAALNAHNALAETYIEDREIWLNPHRHGNIRVDVLHEVMHCAKNLTTVEGRFTGRYGPEENVVAAVAWSLEEIIQDNPRLMIWLSRGS
jgi:hypothetical protein